MSFLPPFDPSITQNCTASCHCGAVQLSIVLSPPLPHWKVVSCNCSICSAHGYLLVYPLRKNVHITSGIENLKTYTFNRHKNLHKFCGICGSAVFFDPRMGEFGEAPPAPDLLGVNVRMFCGVKVEELSILHLDDPYSTPESK